MVLKALKRRAVRLFAKNSATKHWKTQRLTAVALVPLSIWLLVFLDKTLNASYLQTLDWLANPVNSFALLAWVISAFYHAALGVQVVLEDYVSCLTLRKRAIYVVNGVFLVSCLTAVVVILIIIFLGS